MTPSQAQRSAWHKSSYSGNGSACVEVTQPGPVLVRDSKNPARTVLTFPAPQWAAFLATAVGDAE